MILLKCWKTSLSFPKFLHFGVTLKLVSLLKTTFQYSQACHTTFSLTIHSFICCVKKRDGSCQSVSMLVQLMSAPLHPNLSFPTVGAFALIWETIAVKLMRRSLHCSEQSASSHFVLCTFNKFEDGHLGALFLKNLFLSVIDGAGILITLNPTNVNNPSKWLT